MPDIAYVSNDSCHEARQICDFPKKRIRTGRFLPTFRAQPMAGISKTPPCAETKRKTPKKNAVHLYRSERKQERARNSTPFRTSSSILGPRSTKHWREDKRGKSPIGQFFGSQKTKCATLLRAKRESGRAGKPSHLYGFPPLGKAQPKETLKECEPA